MPIEKISTQEEELNEESKEVEPGKFIENFLQANPLNEEALYVKKLLVDCKIYPLQHSTLAAIQDSFDYKRGLTKPEELEKSLLTELDLADTAHMPRSLLTSDYDRYTYKTYNYIWGEKPENLWNKYLVRDYGDCESAQQAVKQQISFIKEGISKREEDIKKDLTVGKNVLEKKRDWIKKLENGILNLTLVQKICKKFKFGEDTTKEAYQIGMKLFEDGIKALNEIREEERQRLSEVLKEKKAGFYEIKEIEPGRYEGNRSYRGNKSYPFFVDDRRRFVEDREDSKFLEEEKDIETISHIKYLDDELLFYVNKGLLEKNIGNRGEARNSFEKVIGLYTEAARKLSPGAKRFLAAKDSREMRELHREIGTAYLNLGLEAIKEGKPRDEYAGYFRRAEQSYLIYNGSNTYMPRVFRIYDIYEGIKDYRTRFQKQI